MEQGVNTVVRGSCLCGGVRFEVTPPFIRANHCHCSRCRKHSGTAVCTQARVWREQFKLLSGESLIPCLRRRRGCGQGVLQRLRLEPVRRPLAARAPGVSIRMGAFDDDPGIAPQFHTYVGSKAPWDRIDDDLPQYDAAWTDPTPPAAAGAPR